MVHRVAKSQPQLNDWRHENYYEYFMTFGGWDSNKAERPPLSLPKSPVLSVLVGMCHHSSLWHKHIQKNILIFFSDATKDTYLERKEQHFFQLACFAELIKKQNFRKFNEPHEATVWFCKFTLLFKHLGIQPDCLKLRNHYFLSPFI